MAFRAFRLGNLAGSAQALVFAALTAGLVVVFYVFYLRVLLEDRASLQTEIARLESAVAQRRTLESRLGQFEGERARLDQRLEILRGILPTRKETADVLRSIQRMAAASRLKIIKFIPQPVAPRPFYYDWPIILEVEGNYHALLAFFERVSRLTRIVHVDSLTVKGINGSTDPLRSLSAICTITTFVFKEAIPDPQ